MSQKPYLGPIADWPLKVSGRGKAAMATVLAFRQALNLRCGVRVCDMPLISEGVAKAQSASLSPGVWTRAGR